MLFARLGLFFTLLGIACFAHSGDMVYRYWDWAKTPKRDNYQFYLLNTILEKTSPEYGDYALYRVMESFSTSRVRREINDGDRINVRVGPYSIADYEVPEAEKNLSIDMPIAANLLGYRRLIIRKADLNKFRAIKTEAALKKLTMGQGRGWEDVKLYRAAGYKVDDNANVDTLFQMLVRGRFDYVSMSVIEVESVLADERFSSLLALAPRTYLYYPLPLVYHVSADRPELAERIARGLEIARLDGSREALLTRFFSSEIEQLKQPENTFFKVDNLNIPEHIEVITPFFTPKIEQRMHRD